LQSAIRKAYQQELEVAALPCSVVPVKLAKLADETKCPICFGE